MAPMAMWLRGTGNLDRLQGDHMQQVALDHSIGKALFRGRLSHEKAGSGERREFWAPDVVSLAGGKADAKGLERPPPQRVLDFVRSHIELHEHSLSLQVSLISP